MKYCETCGAELTEDMRYCSQCGRKVPGRKETGPRDFWAERLQHGSRDEEQICPEPEDEPEAEEQASDSQLPPPAAEEKPRKKPAKSIEPIALPEDFWEDPDQPIRPERPRRSLPARWILALAIASVSVALGILILCLLLVRPGEPVRELYYGRSCTVEGREYPGTGDWVALQSDGRAELFLIGTGKKGTWVTSGKGIVITCGDEFIRGTLEEGILSLEDGTASFVLTNGTVEEILPPSPREQEPADGDWMGDYYGWWYISRAWGRWEREEGERWDLCGQIFADDQGDYHLELWDTRCRENELFCAADLELLPGKTQAGCLRSGEGRFCDFYMEPGAWVLDPGEPPCSDTPDLLRFSGTCQDGDSGFSYEIFMRPWGLDWEAVKTMPLGLLPGGKKLPRHYEDWYMPLVNRNRPMPESFAIP